MLAKLRNAEDPKGATGAPTQLNEFELKELTRRDADCAALAQDGKIIDDPEELLVADKVAGVGFDQRFNVVSKPRAHMAKEENLSRMDGANMKQLKYLD